MDGQLEFAKLVASRLDSARIPYMITGSMALAVYAVPRMTRDVDFVIECRPEDSERVAGLFEADCYVDRSAVRNAAVTRSTFNIIHNASLLKADFIVRKDEKYRKIEFERRRKIDIEGTLLSVVAPEDLVLSKLVWAREGESELQLRDARSVLKAAVNLDQQYLQTWATALHVEDLLTEARR
jgi:predicted nucleotidyltransferase